MNFSSYIIIISYNYCYYSLIYYNLITLFLLPFYQSSLHFLSAPESTLHYLPSGGSRPPRDSNQTCIICHNKTRYIHTITSRLGKVTQ